MGVVVHTLGSAAAGPRPRPRVLSRHTQVHLEPAQVAELVRAALGSHASVERATPLRGGTFNTCWRAALADGSALLLKVAPPADLPLLSYEQQLLRTEADFHAPGSRGPARASGRGLGLDRPHAPRRSGGLVAFAIARLVARELRRVLARDALATRPQRAGPGNAG